MDILFNQLAALDCWGSHPNGYGCGSVETMRRNLETKTQPTIGWAVPTIGLTRYFLFCRKWTQM